MVNDDNEELTMPRRLLTTARMGASGCFSTVVAQELTSVAPCREWQLHYVPLDDLRALNYSPEEAAERRGVTYVGVGPPTVSVFTEKR